MKWYFYHNRKLRELMNNLVLKGSDKPLEPPNEVEAVLIDELRSNFEQIGKTSQEGSKPSEKVWVNNMNRLFDLVNNQDPRKFLHWDVIQKAMFITNAMYVLIELSFLKKQGDWSERWRPAIEEDKTGAPVPYWFHRSSSGNLIHHAYHISQLEKETATDVRTLDYVVECGGGYGSMCRFFRNIGFRGKYIIFDLPHFSALQKYYLQSVGIEISGNTKVRSGMNVQLTSDIEELRDLVEQTEGSKNLFLGTWSLSEIPLDLRASLSPLFKRFYLLFFAYQSIFEEVDNIDYFRGVEESETSFRWKTWEVEPLPTHFYMAGKRE